MNSLFNRWLPGFTLGAWAAAIFGFAFSRHLLDETLTASFRTYALIAAVVLTAGMLVFFLFRMDVNCCSASDCGHGLSRSSIGKVLSFLVLLLPASLAFWASPAALSKIQMENRVAISTPPPQSSNQAKPVSTTASPSREPAASESETAPAQDSATSDFLTRTPNGVIVSDILDLLYAAQDSVLRRDFDGKKVSVTAQLMPDASSNANGKRFKAVRMYMVCCAADARPIATLVEMEKLPDLPEMSWINVSGVATFPVENGRRVSVIRAEKVEKTEPPKDAMVN